MKEIRNKIIIWLFEKYAFDYWVDIQNKNERLKFQKRYNLKENEIEEAMIDLANKPLKEAYDAGRNYEFERIMEEFNRNS